LPVLLQLRPRDSFAPLLSGLVAAAGQVRAANVEYRSIGLCSFFALGPFADFVYVVSIYSIYLNRLAVKLKATPETWQWLS